MRPISWGGSDATGLAKTKMHRGWVLLESGKNEADLYKIAFRGGEVARAAVSGDGDTRLDLYVYDENGNLPNLCKIEKVLFP